MWQFVLFNPQNLSQELYLQLRIATLFRLLPTAVKFSVGCPPPYTTLNKIIDIAGYPTQFESAGLDQGNGKKKKKPDSMTIFPGRGGSHLEWHFHPRLLLLVRLRRLNHQNIDHSVIGLWTSLWQWKPSAFSFHPPQDHIPAHCYQDGNNYPLDWTRDPAQLSHHLLRQRFSNFVCWVFVAL